MSGDMVQAVFAECEAPAGRENRRDGRPCGICGKPVPPKAQKGGEPRKHCSDACRRIAWERAHPGKRGWQAALPGESRVERAFREWIASAPGRYVEREVVRLARELRAAGVRRYGIAGLWERMRWDRAVQVPGSSEWKLDNRHRSLMARHVMETYPDLAGLFATRDLRGRR